MGFNSGFKGLIESAFLKIICLKRSISFYYYMMENFYYSIKNTTFYYSIKNTTFSTAPSVAFLAVCCLERNGA